MLILTLVMLIAAAVVYAGFFLIFKLGWIIAGKKRNKWPLILAGLATVLLFVVLIASAVFGINKYLMPISNVVDKTLQKTALTTGIRPYTDPQYGFTINLAGGTEMGQWIKYRRNTHVLLGFDTNMGFLMKQQKQLPVQERQLPPMSALIIVAKKTAPLSNIPEFLRQEANTFIKSSGKNYTVTAEPDYSLPNMVFMQAKGEADGQPFVLYVLTAVQGDTLYRIWAPANGNPAYLQMVQEEVRSFRPAGLPPAPLVRGTGFTVPAQENHTFPPFIKEILDKHK